MEFKDVFQRLLEEHDIKAKPLGKKIGIDNTSIYFYKRGSLPNVENAVKLANYFNCTLNYLFGLDTYPDEFDFSLTYDISKFYDRYDALLEEKECSHYYLSTLIGLCDSSKDAWKKGAIPKMESLIKIAKFFDVSIDYLVGRSDRV